MPRRGRRLMPIELYLVRVIGGALLLFLGYLIFVMATQPVPDAVAIALAPGLLLGLPVLGFNVMVWTRGQEMRW